MVLAIGFMFASLLALIWMIAYALQQIIEGDKLPERIAYANGDTAPASTTSSNVITVRAPKLSAVAAAAPGIVAGASGGNPWR